MGFLIVSVVSICVIGIYSLLTTNKLEKLGEQRQIQDSLFFKKIQQGFGGIREIKIYNRELTFLNLFQKSNIELYNIAWLYQLIQKLPKLLLETSAVLSMVIVIFILLKLNVELNYIITIIGLFAVAAVRILPSLSRIYHAFQTIKFGLPTISLFYQELAKARYNKQSNKNIVQKENKKLNFNKSIICKNISFSYSDAGRKIFDKASFEIEKGKLIGIQGPSGSGKSTLVDIILGLVTPNAGDVLVDNNKIDSNLSSWQKKISYVPQSVFLMDDKLKRNVAFGLKDESIDEEELKKAVKASELEDFVKSLPNGLDTIIGERGSRLSGGQRQRIGLARALYHKPELLVLDETTSSLEKKTENKIMETISKIKKNITIIIISHNDDLLKNCDFIYYIENLKIVRKK